MYITGKRLKNKLINIFSRRNIFIFVVSFMVAIAVLAVANIRKLSIYEMEYQLERLGGLSYLVFFGLCGIRSMLLLPCGLFSTLGGLLFGPVKGALVTLIGFTAGSLINFYLARFLGRDWAEKFTRGKIGNIDNMIARNGFLSIFLMRIIPVFPFDAVSCVGGLSKVKAREFVPATLLGSIPGVFLYTFLGNSVKELSTRKIVAALIIIAAITIIPLLYQFVFKKKFLENK